jgi:hypothetical protein
MGTTLKCGIPPEARDSSPIIFKLMSSWERTKMPPAREERDKTELVEESRCWIG